MPDHAPASLPPDALDRLTSALLECGGVLSQIVAAMAEFEASGRSASDALPIPDAAHVVVKGTISGLAHRYSRRDLKVAARMISEATDAIVNDVFVVDPDWLDAMDRGDAV